MSSATGKQKAGLGPAAHAAMLLGTGTVLAVAGQVITNIGATHSSSQVIAWTKYLMNVCISAAMGLPGWVHSMHPNQWFGYRPGAPANAWMAELMAFSIGLLDVVAYCLNCLGFPLCGSSLSMVVFAASGQVFTAVTRVVLLGRPLSDRQKAAVMVVVAGLVIRGSPWQLLGSSSISHMSEQQLVGAGYLVASAACYSLLGVLYEKLFTSRFNHLNHTQVNLRLSLVGLICLTAYQLLYTWPRRETLLYEPMEATGRSTAWLMMMHAGFGSLFTVHSYAQGRVLEKSGAMSVGIVNAMRAATVTFTSAALFCGPTYPHLCLSLPSVTSAIIISLGVALWNSAAHKQVMAPAPGAALPVKGKQGLQGGQGSGCKQG